MKYLYKLLSTVLFSYVLFCACEEEDRTYHGPLYYEFSPVECNQTLINNMFVKECTANGDDKICVQLIKPAKETVTIRFRMADQLFFLNSTSKYYTELPEGNGESYEIYHATAQYGEQFTFCSSSNACFDQLYQIGTITIPAGEMFGYIPLNVIKRDGTGVYLILEDSDNAQANVPTSIMNIKFMATKTYYFIESMTEAFPAGWTMIDADGDGKNWYYYESRGWLFSDSYDDNTSEPLTPENYLISPSITVPAGVNDLELAFDLSSAASGAVQEQYRVLISEQPITESNYKNATILRDWTELTSDYKRYTFVTEHISIANYAGKTFYIGFVHGNCTDMYSICLKNVEIYGY